MRSALHIAALLGLILPCALASTVWAEDENAAAYGLAVKEIHIDGLKRTRPYVVERELTTQVGELCAEENLREDVNRLINLDIFSHVEAQARVEGDSASIRYEVVETFPVLPSVALKISDENGLSIGAGVKTPNMMGKDIYGSGRFLVGGEKTLEIELENPWFAGNRFAYRLEFFHRNRDNAIANFYETTYEFYLWLRFPVKQTNDYMLTLIPSGQFLSIGSDRDGATLDPDNSDEVARLGLAVSYDSRDKITDTRSGWRNELKLSQEMRIIQSDTNFAQLDIDLRRYQPTFWERQTLGIFFLTSLRTGKVREEVAPWQLFGIGGTNTVRGWDYASRRGKNQFITFAEYSWTVMEPRLFNLPFGIKYRGGLQVAAFGDLGIGWFEAGEFGTRNFLGGGGAGVRLLLPIVSMVRFDFGVGQDGAGIQIHIGSWEKAEMARKRVR